MNITYVILVIKIYVFYVNQIMIKNIELSNTMTKITYVRNIMNHLLNIVKHVMKIYAQCVKMSTKNMFFLNQEVC